MKTQLLLLILTSCFSTASAQRYLTPVFNNLDSVIAGVYGTALNNQSANQNLLFDFYEPAGDTVLKRPLLIYIHGGGFNSGSREYPSVKLLCQKMAKKGYAVATIDYRLEPGFDIYNSTTDRRAMTDAMHDAKQAIRFFKTNAGTYKLDTNKVFIGGESAGAATSMMASYIDKQTEMSSYPKSNPNNPIGNSSNLSVTNQVAATLCLCGLLLDTVAMESNTTSSILWIHGSEDKFIPISLAANVVTRALNVGIPIQTKTYQGANHCPWYYGNPNWNTYLDSTITEITNFLYPLVTGITSVKDMSITSLASIYPNPATNNITVQLTDQHTKVNVTIISTTGEIVKEITFQNTKKLVLSLDDLSTGIYFLRMEFDNRIESKRIIKH